MVHYIKKRRENIFGIFNHLQGVKGNGGGKCIRDFFIVKMEVFWRELPWQPQFRVEKGSMGLLMKGRFEVKCMFTRSKISVIKDGVTKK